MTTLVPLGLEVPVAAAAVTPKTALFYGDSLTWESQWQIGTYFATKAGWSEHVEGFPGTAVCDWLPSLSQDLATYHPSVVGIETAGNNITACMEDTTGVSFAQGSQAFYDRYTSDLNTFFATVTATGAKVVFIEAPPMLNATWNNAITGIQKLASQEAASYPGVSISNRPRNAVSRSGTYQAYKPCRSTETSAMGCVSGQIPIRTITGIQTGIHFCPTGLTSSYPFACATYSSGEYRFGTAAVNTVISPPPPVRPTK